MALRRLLAVTTGSAIGYGSFLYVEGRDSASYHNFVNNIAMPAILCIDPEKSHRFAVQAGAAGILPIDGTPDDPVLATSVFGIDFPNPVGLAAGFDKHAETIDGMHDVGFGFVEIGSVTPKPQGGNPLPRVFRLTADKAVINRYGFNSDGAEVVAGRLQERAAAPHSGAILGVNLGKNKLSTDAVGDYVCGMRRLGEFADYVVINVSSPNTPGLRVLQGREQLTAVVSAVAAERDAIVSRRNKPLPLLVKIAPDLVSADQADIAAVATSGCGVDGLIVSNTTVARPDSLASEHKAEGGGLSGAPLMAPSTQILRQMYVLTEGKVPLVGVGGIASGADAYEKVRAGASLLQLYSCMVFHGPALVPAVKQELAALLKRDGFASIADAVGSGNPLTPPADGSSDKK